MGRYEKWNISMMHMTHTMEGSTHVIDVDVAVEFFLLQYLAYNIYHDVDQE